MTATESRKNAMALAFMFGLRSVEEIARLYGETPEAVEDALRWWWNTGRNKAAKARKPRRARG